MDVVGEVRAGRAQVEWAEVKSEHAGMTLYISVIRDALKIDGVRVAANAQELQQIADMLGAMLLTPRVIDLIWQQAAVRFEPVIRADNNIVAVSTSERVSALIDEEIGKQGGDGGGIVDSVGKYWVLHNALANPAALKYGKRNACNYGWLGKTAQFAALTPGIKCWQQPGFQHNDEHADPSQLVRLMQRQARLIYQDGNEEAVDLVDVLADSNRAPLVNHDGVLRYLRVSNVPAPDGPIDPAEVSPYG